MCVANKNLFETFFFFFVFFIAVHFRSSKKKLWADEEKGKISAWIQKFLPSVVDACASLESTLSLFSKSINYLLRFPLWQKRNWMSMIPVCYQWAKRDGEFSNRLKGWWIWFGKSSNSEPKTHKCLINVFISVAA